MVLAFACTALTIGGVFVAVVARPAEGDPELDASEAEFLTLLNAYRASSSLAPLQHDPRLTAASEWLANDEANNDYVGHTDSLNRATTKRVEDIVGKPLPYVGIGENVSGGYPTAQGVLDGWKNSAPHDRNLRGDFNAIGISRICKSNTTYGCYWATNFGKASGPIPTAAALTTPALTASPSPSPTPSDAATSSATTSLTPSPTVSPSPTPTPSASASPSPVPTEGSGLRRMGDNTLVVPMVDDDTTMFIASAGALGLQGGDFIVINPGGTTDEVFEIIDLSPLTLDHPAAFDHGTDELVQQIHRGDANCDGKVTGSDILAALAAAADLDPGERCQPMANADCNGNTDEMDSLWILLRTAEIAAFEAVNCSPVGGGLPAATLLQVAAPAGVGLIEPLGMNDFHIGDTIRINAGGPNEEDNVITGIGSFVLQSALLFSHNAGEPIVKVLDVPDFVVPTTTPSPSLETTQPPTESPTDTPEPTDTPTPSPTASPSPTPTESPL